MLGKALEQANRPRRFKVSDGGARKEHADRPQRCDVCWQIEGVVEIKRERPDGQVSDIGLGVLPPLPSGDRWRCRPVQRPLALRAHLSSRAHLSGRTRPWLQHDGSSADGGGNFGRRCLQNADLRSGRIIGLKLCDLIEQC